MIPSENLLKPYICKYNNPRISRNLKGYGNNNWSLGVGVRCEYPHLIWFTLAYESWITVGHEGARAADRTRRVSAGLEGHCRPLSLFFSPSVIALNS